MEDRIKRSVILRFQQCSSAPASSSSQSSNIMQSVRSIEKHVNELESNCNAVKQDIKAVLKLLASRKWEII